jgi:[ribosomal protein S5]-alanine N-acetyltransferase
VRKALHMSEQGIRGAALLARGDRIAMRRIEATDLGHICRFPFTVSITEPLSEPELLARAFGASGFWTDVAGAVAIVDVHDGRFVGTAQFYRSAPCIHGFELGYIVHDPADRGRGRASEAVRLFADHLFEALPDVFRLQLIIEAWNVPSWKLAERCGFVREGLLRSAGFGPGDPVDCFLYCRTRKDWREARDTSMGTGLSPSARDGGGWATPPPSAASWPSWTSS